MIYEIDTGKIEKDIARRVRLGFTLQSAVLLTLVFCPPLWAAIIRGVEEGMEDETRTSGKECE